MNSQINAGFSKFGNKNQVDKQKVFDILSNKIDEWG